MQKILIILTLCLCTLLLVEGQTYKVGDLYTAPDGSQGIVYYLHPDGSGGWVVALTDASSSCTWGTTTDVPGLTNLNPTNKQNLMSDTAGYAHTRTLRNYQNNNTNYAAGKVDFANGWVLPAPGQLATLYGQLPLIATALTSAGGTTLANKYYWTSAEDNANYAWLVDFGEFNNSGTLTINTKTYSYYVRAVRSFTYESYVDLHYEWNTGDTTPGITVSPAQTTTYTVTVSSTIGGSDTVEKTIVVGEPASSEFTIVSDTPYTWNGITYNQSGNYTQTFTTVIGCDSVVTLHLTVNIAPEVSITASDDEICEGEEVTLQAVVLNEEVFTFVPQIAIGDILCTDGSTVKPSDWPVAGKTAYGIVFYVDGTGEHGWAVHLHNQGVDIRWGQQGDVILLPDYTLARDAIQDLDGYNNTQIIRNAGNASSYDAAYAVDFPNGWYLPAIGQLSVMVAALDVIDASLAIVGGTQFPTDGSYIIWSSTESGIAWVWYTYDSGHIYNYAFKNYTGGGTLVRSIRDF